MSTLPALEFRDVSFTWAGRPAPALSGISLAVAPGELVVVAGRNGAGKSTLALAANGTIPHLARGAFAGEVRLGGRPAGPPRDSAAEVGAVFQDFEAHLVSSTAELETAFPLENAGVPADTQRARVRETLALVGLAGFELRVPAELSGGEKQRLAIAAAIAREPAVVVLDEPLTDLDPAGKRQVLEVVGRLRGRGIGVLLIEHDPAAFLAADRVAVLAAGRVVWTGAPAGLLGDPALCGALGLAPWPPAVVAKALRLPPGPWDLEAVAGRIRSAGGISMEQAESRKQTDDRGDSRTTVSSESPPSRSPSSARASAPPLIEFLSVSSGYPAGPEILRDVTMTIRRGESVALLGQNGSGKTTLAKHAAGLLRPRRGELRIDGRPAGSWKMADRSRVVGYVFQNPDHQIFSETIGDEVAFGARNLGIAGDALAERVRESLAAVGLQGREGDDPFTATKGDRQRIAVASLLAYRPAAIIFDEPTTGLDAGEAHGMMEFIRGLRSAGTTVILITHAMWAAAEYADRVVVMAGGRVVLDGPPGEVFAREDVLEPLALAPPPAAGLANRLGLRALTADALVSKLAS